MKRRGRRRCERRRERPDEELAIIGTKSLESMDMAGLANEQAPLPVTYIGSLKVVAAFANGTVLSE